MGIGEGCIIANGDRSDLSMATDFISRGVPVIAVKAIGGASEYVCNLIEKRQGPPHNRPVGFQKRFSDGVLEKEYEEVFFQIPADSTDAELVVVDATNPAVGKVLQKQMAELLSLAGGGEEKQLGYAAAELSRITKAWSWSLLFRENACKEKLLSDLYNYFMLLLNLLVVVLVVVKQVAFREEFTAEMDAAWAGNDGYELEKEAKQVVSVILVIMPIVSGVLLTFNNAFNPITKYHALRWASQTAESEVYRYRTRSNSYGAGNAGLSWAELLQEEAEAGAGGTLSEAGPSKTFVTNLTDISSTLLSGPIMQLSALKEPKKGIKHVVAQKVETLFRGTVDSRDEIGQKEYVDDDGYGLISAEDYICVRVIPQLATMKRRLPPLTRRLKTLQALTYVATGVSVLLGTLEFDIYIAVSTAVVSMLTGIIQYQTLESTIISLNIGATTLTHLLLWWDSLSFIERRMPQHKNHLVTSSEEAILTEVNAFFQTAPDDAPANEGEEEEPASG
eukprot:SAG31_NODE_1868_length_7028_cov_4.100303_3_plen_505_part_00